MSRDLQMHPGLAVLGRHLWAQLLWHLRTQEKLGFLAYKGPNS